MLQPFLCSVFLLDRVCSRAAGACEAEHHTTEKSHEHPVEQYAERNKQIRYTSYTLAAEYLSTLEPTSQLAIPNCTAVYRQTAVRRQKS